MIATTAHRPRNVDVPRAASILYGDWGASKALVISLAFVPAGFASFPLILAVCALTAVVGSNYIIVCAHFPDGGGGVYSGMSISGVTEQVGPGPSSKQPPYAILIGTWCFTVTNLAKAGYTYNPGDNTVTAQCEKTP